MRKLCLRQRGLREMNGDGEDPSSKKKLRYRQRGWEEMQMDRDDDPSPKKMCLDFPSSLHHLHQ